MMHIHILGIGGTFMAGIAAIAKQLGHQVTGQDRQLYPPMSTQLTELGISWHEGYDSLWPQQALPDVVIVGNAMKRGMPVIEAMLDQRIAMISGPQWLYENVLKHKWVIAVAGTHGKTTTASMIASVLEHCGHHPGFLIGGIGADFNTSARITDSPYFVIEADEYDTAFFDKRSKFVHYYPKTLVLNNLEFDHADIFENLDQIKKQFHHLVRIVPANGQIILPASDQALQSVLAQGCWTPQSQFGIDQGDWQAQAIQQGGSHFTVVHQQQKVGECHWQCWGLHNVNNALATLATCQHVGVPATQALTALAKFKGVARRAQHLATIADIDIFEDFAHHPTAIESTLMGFKQRFAGRKIKVILDPDSYTMRSGWHHDAIINSLQAADQAIVKIPAAWPELEQLIATAPSHISGFGDAEQIVAAALKQCEPGDIWLMMSNAAFKGVRDQLVAAFEQHFTSELTHE